MKSGERAPRLDRGEGLTKKRLGRLEVPTSVVTLDVYLVKHFFKFTSKYYLILLCKFEVWVIETRRCKEGRSLDTRSSFCDCNVHCERMPIK